MAARSGVEILALAASALRDTCARFHIDLELRADVQCGDVRVEASWTDGPPRSVVEEQLLGCTRDLPVTWDLHRDISTLSQTAALIAVLDELPPEEHTNAFVWDALTERVAERYLPDASLNHDKAMLMLSMLPEDFSWSSALAWLVRNNSTLDAALAPAAE